MSIEYFINKLNKLNLQIKVSGNELVLKAPKGKLDKELIQEIKERKQALIKHIKASSANNYKEVKYAELKEYYPLSPMQRRIFNIQSNTPDATQYNMPFIFKIPATLTKEQIYSTLKIIISRHEAFRTHFKLINNSPVQVIGEDVFFELNEYNVKEEDIFQFKQENNKPFNLSELPLFRIALINSSNNQKFLYFVIHHIVFDEVSQEIIKNEFISLIESRELQQMKTEYKEFSEWKNCSSHKNILNEQKVFWKNIFAKEVQVLDLPVDFARKPNSSYRGASVRFLFDKEVSRNIKSLIIDQTTTPFIFFLSLINIFFSKICNTEDVTVGTVVANRQHNNFLNIIGLFANILAIRNYPVSSMSIREFLYEVKQRSFKMFENQDYDFGDLIKAVPNTSNIGHYPFFNVGVNYENSANSDALSINNQNLRHDPIETKGLDLQFKFIESNDQFIMSLDYDTELFRKETIEKIIDTIQNLTYNLIQDIDSKISDIELISETEKEIVLNEFNIHNFAGNSDSLSIHSTFNKLAERKPDSIALQFKDQNISYGFLDKISSTVSSYLIKSGIKQNEIVGLVADRTPEMIVNLLGILKSGAAYVPIDPELPIERMKFIIKDCKPRYILGRNKGEGSDQLEVKYLTIPDYSQPEKISENGAAIISNNHDVSQIIYTSGSTGIPKGVVIKHEHVLSLIVPHVKELKIHDTDNILLFSTITFDASVEQIWLALLSGSTLSIIDNADLIDKKQFEKHLKKYNVTCLYLVPSYLEGLNLEDNNSIKKIVMGGEECKAIHTNELFDKVEFYNEYGPTEASISASKYRIKNKFEDQEAIPIGKPVGNKKIYICDKDHKLLPIGFKGEICIGGDGITLGYLNDTSLTNAKFVKDAYYKNRKMYCTGDIGIWQKDGNLQFSGRKDDFVKIRGYRIEIGEIESNLLLHPDVRKCKVVSINNKDICAYIILKNQDTSFDIYNYRSFLEKRLSTYMIPSIFIHLREFPLTPSGKIDLPRLPKPNKRVLIDEKFILALKTNEEKLKAIWAKVLDVDMISVDTDRNFFIMGGNSLKVIEIAKLIESVFKREISVSILFKYPSIKTIAEYLGNKGKSEEIETKRIEEAKNLRRKRATRKL